MKKIFKILSFVLALGSFFMLTLDDVQAEKVKIKFDYQSNVYYTRIGSDMNESHQFLYYSLNGVPAFCIEPGVDINDWDYITGDITKSPYNDEITNKIVLIGHYGYDYPNHQTQKYRMATQALIWETVKDLKVEFYTKQYGKGDHIDISKEKNEIMRLVNSHNDKPSFNGNTFNATIKEEIVIEDANNILSNFDIVDNGGNDISFEGNKLHIIPNSMGKSTITLEKKKYDNKATIIYTGEDGKSQKLGRFRYSVPVNSYLILNTTGGTVSIEKVDFETNIPQGDAVLSGAVYGVYDEYDALLTKITTDNNGYAKSTLLNKLGKFYVKEISSSNGYLLDNTKYYFEITEDNLNVSIQVKEVVIKGKFDILKLYGIDSLIPENNITFNIYLKSTNKLINSITTDNNGVASITLPYGTYIIKQKNTTINYEKVSDFEINIDENNKIISKNLINKPLSAKLKIVKVDMDTKEIVKISGIKFKIKNLANNEYVCQKITYPSASTLCEFETNEDGVFITPNDLLGDFEIEEVESQKIDGYLWNNEKIKVHIGDNSQFENDSEYGKIVTVKFADKRVLGKIEIIKYGEKLKIKDNKVSYEEIPLNNVKFGLYKEDGTLISNIITDKDGRASIDNLELGKYYIQELSVDSAYIIDNNRYNFELKYKDQYTKEVVYTLKIKNKLKKGVVEFLKTDLISGSPIPNTKINFYTSDNKLIFSGITDKNGKIVIKDLPVGKYYIEEIEASTGYLLSDEKVYFEIKEDGKIVKANMTNKKITGNFELTKIDLSTSEPLPNTLFEIYNADTDELLFSERTNELGQITISNLEYGNYYFIESQAPEGYILNDEKVYFEIKYNGDIVNSTVTNEKMVVEVPKTSLNDSFVLDIVAVVLILVGIGYVFYDKRKDK